MYIRTRHLLPCLPSWAILGIVLHTPCAPAAEPAVAPPVPHQDLSTQLEVERAIDRGLDWLRAHQNEAGWWSTADQPALTALALVAFQGHPKSRYAQPDLDWMNKGYAFLLANQHPDGSLHRGQLVNYNTSLSLLALAGARRPAYEDTIVKARNYLAGTQHDFGAKGKLDTPMDGGIGYGSSYEHSDMANTLQALEALYYSKEVVADRDPAGLKELDWKAALHFIQSCQNLPSHNTQDWVSGDPAQRGGFIYYPGLSKAGTQTNEVTGKVALRSYGSISYAGLLSYIYAQLDRDDPRVQAVYQWLQQNYTLEENPGMGAQGLFYYYHTMAKALNAYGLDQLTLADGSTVAWRRELAMHLINLQQPDGSWINQQHGRWWERDPVLVTAYAVLALELAYRRL